MISFKDLETYVSWKKNWYRLAPIYYSSLRKEYQKCFYCYVFNHNDQLGWCLPDVNFLGADELKWSRKLDQEILLNLTNLATLRVITQSLMRGKHLSFQFEIYGQFYRNMVWEIFHKI